MAAQQHSWGEERLDMTPMGMVSWVSSYVGQMSLQRDEAAGCTAKRSIKVCSEASCTQCHSCTAPKALAIICFAVQRVQSSLRCPAQGCCKLWLLSLSLSVMESQPWSVWHAEQLVSRARDTIPALSSAFTQRQGSPLAGACFAPR